MPTICRLGGRFSVSLVEEPYGQNVRTSRWNSHNGDSRILSRGARSVRRNRSRRSRRARRSFFCSRRDACSGGELRYRPLSLSDRRLRYFVHPLGSADHSALAGTVDRRPFLPLRLRRGPPHPYTRETPLGSL